MSTIELPTPAPEEGFASPGLSPRRLFRVPSWSHPTLLAMGYFGLAWLGWWLSLDPSHFVSFWMPSGFTLAALLLAPTPRWPRLLTAAALANLAFNASIHHPWGRNLGFTVANLLEVATAATLIRAYVSHSPRLQTVREVAGFVAIAGVFSPALSGILGTWLLMGSEAASPLGTWASWWTGSAMGVMIVAPLILTWVPRRGSGLPRTPARVAEAIGSSVLLWVAATLIQRFDATQINGIKFLLLPIVAWIGIRFGPRGASVASLILACTLAPGPYPDRPGGETLHVIIIQTFIFISGAGNLCLSALIAALRRTETHLRSSESRFRHFFAHLTDYCFILDARGRISDANAAAVRVLGLAREDLIGTPIEEVFASADRRRAEEIMSRWRSGVPVKGELLTLVGEDEQPRTVRIDTIPIGLADSLVPQGACVLADVTERRHLEDQLRQSQKLEAIGRLAGGVAHDFSNLLSAMMVHLGLLKATPGIPEPAREVLQELEAESRRASRLTRQLLLFGRRSVIQKQRLDLNEVIDNLLKMLRRLLGEHVRLEWHPGAHVPGIEADPGMLEQVIMNLCVNARDAMPGGGRLTLTTDTVEVLPGQPLRHPAARPGKFARLSVRDTGMGMSDETLRHIFEPFFTTKEPGQGTGLGLPTVYGVVQQHHGWVEVETRLQHGSTFSIFLPAVQNERPEAVPPAPRAAPRGGHETILLVEDDAVVRRGAVQYLRVHGYRVHDVGSAHEARRLWAEHSPEIDLLITDVVLPGGVSGLALAQELRKSRGSLPMIICSGYNAGTDPSALKDLSGVVFLSKPYDAAVLVETVRACLDRQVNTSNHHDHR